MGIQINIKYGSFLSNLINFLLMAFCIFICIKAINKVMSFRKKEEEAVPAPKPEDIALLEEIRDLLKEKNKHLSAYNVGSSRSSLR